MSIPSQHRPGGLKVIIWYKLAKAGAELLAGAIFFTFGSGSLAADLAAFAQTIRRHATEAWSIALAEKLLDVSTAHNIFVVAMAIVADGVLSLLEGWALARGFRWARWLVLATTAALVPFEILHVIRRPSVGHFALLAANTIIVVYLARRHPVRDELGPQHSIEP